MEYRINGFTIRKVGNDWKVIYETSSISEVRFIGTQEECEYFCSLGSFCHKAEVREYVRDMRSLKVWL